jgi:putative colanic acid biosynthesis UDP-glucose lipid carrier transferase
MEGRVEFDMEYIQNWSFYWDLKIIWLTIFGRNALKNVS